MGFTYDELDYLGFEFKVNKKTGLYLIESF